HFIEDNEDLGRYNVASLLQRSPLNAEALLDEGRDTIGELIKQHPMLPQSLIREYVLRRPRTYEEGLLRYAEKYGIALGGGDEEIPDAGDFLQSLRQLLRSRQYDIRNIMPTTELAEAARRLGQEALDVMNQTDDMADEYGAAPNPALRESFEKKIQQLIITASMAWRHGDLPVTPEHASVEFRALFYRQVLAEFMTIH